MPDLTEYDLYSQGAKHSYTPPFDGRDPMRNRPLDLATVSPTIARYGFGRAYTANTGSPAIIEQADGEYVRYDDHLAEIGELQAERAALEAVISLQAESIKSLRLMLRNLHIDVAAAEINRLKGEQLG